MGYTLHPGSTMIVMMMMMMMMVVAIMMIVMNMMMPMAIMIGCEPVETAAR